jgi:uncharacterized protein (TIGR00288 family)
MNDKNIAIFIDSDNAPASKIEAIIEKLAELGSTSIKRAYGNWKKPALKSWEDKLHSNGIQSIQQFDLVKGKNASDIAIAIDMMDVLYTKDNIDIFAIVTSDCDFTPLAMRIRSEGKMVIGFGETKTPEPFVNSCSKFINIDRILEKSKDFQVKSQSMDRMTPAQLKQDSKLLAMIRSGIEAHKEDDGWAMMSKVGSYISNLSSITPENYGYRKLGDIIKAIDLFECKSDETNNQPFIRDKNYSQ